MNIEKVPTIRVLREPDLRKLLDVPTAIEIIERTYKEYGLNDSHTLSNPLMFRKTFDIPVRLVQEVFDI